MLNVKTLKLMHTSLGHISWNCPIVQHLKENTFRILMKDIYYSKTIKRRKLHLRDELNKKITIIKIK